MTDEERTLARCTGSGNCLEWRPTEDGGVEIRNTRQPDVVVAATAAEWAAFVRDLIPQPSGFITETRVISLAEYDELKARWIEENAPQHRTGGPT